MKFKVTCPECGKKMVLRKEPKKYFYVCTRWPKCSGYHSAHSSGAPMGVPANYETRQSRIAAHASFDEFRTVLALPRNKAYRWLQKMLGLSAKDCHIAMFDKKMCEKVIEICDRALSTVKFSEKLK